MASPLAQAAKHSVAALHQTFGILPAAAYTCDGEGLITYFNRHARAVWGRTPLLNHPDERYCGAHRLIDGNGNRINREDCWMALAIKNRKEYAAQETLIERPNGTRVMLLSYATPLLAPDGSVASAMNILVNISDRKHVEDLLDSARQTRDFYRAALADALREQLQPMRAIVRRLCAGAAGVPGLTEPLRELEMHLIQMRSLVNEMVDSPESPTEPEPAVPAWRDRRATRRTRGEEPAAGRHPAPPSP